MKNKYAIIQVLLMVSLALAASACTSQQPATIVETSASSVTQVAIPADPGSVEFVWEAPMVDVIDVPPGLDPEGIYYRPSHQAVVEIRQGRWEYYHPNK